MVEDGCKQEQKVVTGATVGFELTLNSSDPTKHNAMRNNTKRHRLVDITVPRQTED